jgi:protoporphyrinogen oxidase
MKVNVIGAGITGLCAAYFLSQKGHAVRVFDSSNDVGGLAGSFPVGPTYLEKYYHHCFAGHLAFLDLARELGLERDVFYRSVKMGFCSDATVYPFATALDLMGFRPLSVTGRIRLGLTSLLMMRIKDWRNLEKRSALEWLQRYSGEEACRIIWEPLLKMKFGDAFANISAAWLWNRVVDRKRSSRGKDVIGYMRHGYKSLFDAMLKALRACGGELLTGAPVERLRIEDGSCSGVVAHGSFYPSDIVLATVPIPSFLRMTESLPADYVAALTSVRYQGSICVVLSMRKPLSEYYWINVSDHGCPFVAVIEHTNLASPEWYGNRHIAYLTKYASSESEIFSKPDDQIYREFIPHVQKVFRRFDERDVEEFHVFRDQCSQPVFVKNFSMLKPACRTPVENLYLLNTTQLYPESRTLNTSIAKAREFADEEVKPHGC